jgi:hypothetical protein
MNSMNLGGTGKIPRLCNQLNESHLSSSPLSQDKFSNKDKQLLIDTLHI